MTAEWKAFDAQKERLSRWDYQRKLRRLGRAMQALQAERRAAGE